jgi:hypothetical protein
LTQIGSKKFDSSLSYSPCPARQKRKPTFREGRALHLDDRFELISYLSLYKSFHIPLTNFCFFNSKEEFSFGSFDSTRPTDSTKYHQSWSKNDALVRLRAPVQGTCRPYFYLSWHLLGHCYSCLINLCLPGICPISVSGLFRLHFSHLDQSDAQRLIGINIQ